MTIALFRAFSAGWFWLFLFQVPDWSPADCVAGRDLVAFTGLPSAAAAPGGLFGRLASRPARPQNSTLVFALAQAASFAASSELAPTALRRLGGGGD